MEQPPQEVNKDWPEAYEWGPEPEMWLPDSEEELGEDF